MEPFFDKYTITEWIAIFGAIAAVVKYFWDDHRERTAVQTALLVEVERLIWVIRNHRKWFGAGKPDPLVSFSTDCYDQQVKDIGKLTSPLAIKIVKFYGYVKFLNRMQAARDEYHKAGLDAAFNSLYVSQLAEFEDQFGAMFTSVFRAYGITETA